MGEGYTIGPAGVSAHASFLWFVSEEVGPSSPSGEEIGEGLLLKGSAVSTGTQCTML